MSNNNVVNGHKAPSAGPSDEIDAASLGLNEEQKHQMFRIWCAMLHRMAWAAGGTLALRLRDIPDAVPFDFKTKDGVATFIAMPLKQPNPAVVRASAEQLEALRKQFPG